LEAATANEQSRVEMQGLAYLAPRFKDAVSLLAAAKDEYARAVAELEKKEQEGLATGTAKTKEVVF